MACTECKRRNYQTNKSKRNSPDRLEFSKYCKWCGKHTVHRETRQAALARRNRQQPQQGRRSVTAPVAGKPKSQSGGEPVERPNLFRRVVGFTGEVRGELAKTDFPDRHQTWQSTSVVIAACVIVGLYLYGLDQAFARLVQKLVELQN